MKKKKGIVKKLSYQRERTKFGPKPISQTYSQGLSREEYTKPWYDDCKLGIIYTLHKFTPKEKLSMKEIGNRIGWRIRSVKNGLSNLRKTGLLRTSIQTMNFKYRCVDKSFTKFYLNCPPISQLTFEEVLRMYNSTTTIPNNHKPNKCEQGLLDICNELYPGCFRFNGAQIYKNKVGEYYPDIVHVKYPIVIEHFGSTFHEEKEEIERIDRLGELGYISTVIWDYDPNKDYQEAKEFLGEWIPHALENILQLAV